MRETDIQLILTSLAPEPVWHHGKTGAGVRLAEILKCLKKTDETDILCICTPHNKKNFEESGARVEFKTVNTNLKFKGFVGLCLKSLLILAKSFFVLNLDFLNGNGQRKIVYASSDLFWEVFPVYYFKLRKKNTEWVQVIHHIYPDWEKRPGSKVTGFFGFYFQRFSFWLIRRKADKIIVLNSLVKNELLKRGFSESRIFVSVNGVDVDYFESVGKSGVAYDGVFLGRLSPSKGVSDLVEIWKNVLREIPEARLAIVGGGGAEEKNFLLKKIRDSGLEKNIDLLGYLEDEKAHPILKSAKIFLFPSHEEGWGIAIAEAMACGLPVVSWDLSVFGEIFGDCIIQIKENDTGLFSEKVVGLLNQEALRKKIGADGKEFVKKYSWNKVADREWEIITGKTS
jgi:glycosyltransferase involved in cell wall biosynthesis